MHGAAACNLARIQRPQLPQALASWGNEGGAVCSPNKDIGTRWFVPPVVVPALLGVVVLARGSRIRQNEHKFSGPPRTADMTRTCRQVPSGPGPDSGTAQKNEATLYQPL